MLLWVHRWLLIRNTRRWWEDWRSWSRGIVILSTNTMNLSWFMHAFITLLYYTILLYYILLCSIVQCIIIICCNLRLEEQLHDLKKARTAELIHFLTVKNTAEFDGEDDWADGWLDWWWGWMDKWMIGWIEGIDGWMDGDRKGDRVDGWMDGWMKGWMDGIDG